MKELKDVKRVESLLEIITRLQKVLVVSHYVSNAKTGMEYSQQQPYHEGKLFSNHEDCGCN